MEQPKRETEHSGQTKAEESEPGPEPNPKNSGHVANGQGNEAGPVNVSESESDSDSRVQTEQSNLRMTSSGTTKKSVRWNPELVTESTYESSPQARSFLSYPSFSVRDTFHTVRNAFGRWRKTVGETTRKAEDLAGNTWQHLKTSPSFSEAAIGRIAQGTKVLVEGGYEKVFRLTFETAPEEELQSCYACYLSTSAGPVMGVLYISTSKIAYSSDNPLSYQCDDRTEWSYYKVVIPLDQLKAVNPSSSHDNPSEKYIQLISLDDQEFWFMGFLNYEGAVICLQEAYEANKTQAA